MTSPPDRQFILELVVKTSNPALLEGLDVWLELGLLDNATVLRICQEQLSCHLPATAPVTIVPAMEAPATTDFVTPEFVPLQAETPPVANRPVGWLAQMTQSFMAELSVVWLLFLGVFMVVVSSGVLAATQWRNFSPVGQYAILLGYTLAFWVACVVLGKRANLRLTSRMLQIATLLIIPVNFWMMDSFRLWQTTTGISIAAIAAILLTSITIALLKPAPPRQQDTLLTVTTAIALSWLHWGWQWAGFPLVATYVGTVGAALSLAYQDWQRREVVHDSQEANTGTEAAMPSHDQPSTSPTSVTVGLIAVAFGTLLLLARAIFVAQVPVTRLGLAAGICGWLLCWLARRDATRRLWTQVGVGLLLLGWLMAVMVVPPWQAIAISGLALWLLADYLWRSGQVDYLTAGFLVGLQACWLCWRVLPPIWQESIIAAGTRMAGTRTMPIALLSVWFFPYLLLTLVLALRLRHWQRPVLARQAELLSLGLGIVLTAISLGNPLLRWVNLVLSTLTLIVFISQRRQAIAPLIYLTHGTGLAAIAAGIDQFLPNLSLTSWATMLLVGTVSEWVFSTVPTLPAASAPESPRSPRSIWQRSAWYYGLVLALISYILLQNSPWQDEAYRWNIIWLVVPLSLTGLAYRQRSPLWQLAGWLSVVTLFMAQVLLIESSASRLTGLGIGTVLMLLNTPRLRHLLAAVLTVWFGLSFAGMAVWETYRENLTYEWTLNLLAIAIFTLWLLRGVLTQRRTDLAILYKKATDGWAIALTFLFLCLLSLTLLFAYSQWGQANQQYVVAIAIVMGGLLYRAWQSPLVGITYLVAWNLELLTVGILSLTNPTIEAVAIANLGLGLSTQLLGDWWTVSPARQLPANREPDQPDESSSLSPRFPLSWHLIPLLYAAFGLFLAHGTFTATTGFYTLAAGLVGIGVGRRQAALKPLTFLSLLGLSLGAYELLLYQLAQAKGGSTGDGIVLLAALAAGLAIALQLLSPWLAGYLHLTRPELRLVAHLHWGLGIVFLLGAILNPLSATGDWLWIGIGTLHSLYALAMGNRYLVGNNDPSRLTLWTYAGTVLSLLTLAYGLYLLLPNSVLVDWAGAIAAVLACFLYWLPWQRWGWEQHPWRTTAAILPGVAVMLTGWGISLQALLIVAAFYAWLAKAEHQVRLSYISILLADWAIFRLFNTYGLNQPLWYAVVIGLSTLYVAQIDPGLRSPTERDKRHLLRSLATGLICLTGLYQSEIGITGVLPVLVGLLSIVIALGFVLAGILLRIRAFLYVGTITFIIQLLRQIWLFVNDYPILLWLVIGVVGLGFIWIAATFEARRSQISTLVEYWTSELDAWE